MAKKRSKKKEQRDPNVFVLPDEALSFIVSKYVERRANTSGVPVLVGIPPKTVEEVLRLFLEWANARGHLKDGTLTLSSE